MKYAVITGVSSGLGLETAKLLLASNVHVIGVSRTDHDSLYEIAQENNVDYTHYVCDLSVPNQVAEMLQKVDKKLADLDENDQLYVMNNAAVIQPIQRADAMSQEDLTAHYQVNVLAPMQIMNAMLTKSSKQQFTCIGANITSGAAVSPLYGWSAYCSSKASMNMYTKTVALEQAELKTENKLIGFNPGVMDTNMQAEIRGADKADSLLNCVTAAAQQ